MIETAMQMFTQSLYIGSSLLDRDNTAYRWDAEQPNMVLTPLRSFNLQLSAAFADPLAIILHDAYDHADDEYSTLH